MGDKALADWLGDATEDATPELPDAVTRTGSRRLIVLALLPWLVSAGLAAALVASSRWVAQAPDQPVPPPTTAPAARVSPASSAPILQVPTAAQAAKVEPAVRAALAAAHGALVDAVVVEALEQASGVHVARAWVLVVEREGGRWQPPRPARYAVPVRLTDHVAEPVGGAWALPLAPAPSPRWEPVPDSAATTAAMAAVTDAGYRSVRQPKHERSSELGVARLSFSGRGPAGGDIVGHMVWVTDEPVPRVLGTDRSAAATPAAQPGEAPHER